MGYFTCITQHTGPTALRPIRRTKQLWLSVLLKDTSAATGQAGIPTHILTIPELEPNALDRSGTTLNFCVAVVRKKENMFLNEKPNCTQEKTQNINTKYTAFVFILKTLICKVVKLLNKSEVFNNISNVGNLTFELY